MGLFPVWFILSLPENYWLKDYSTTVGQSFVKALLWKTEHPIVQLVCSAGFTLEGNHHYLPLVSNRGTLEFLVWICHDATSYVPMGFLLI